MLTRIATTRTSHVRQQVLKEVLEDSFFYMRIVSTLSHSNDERRKTQSENSVEPFAAFLLFCFSLFCFTYKGWHHKISIALCNVS